MSLGIALVVADDFVFVAKDFLLGLEQLQVGRGGLWDFMVVFNFELVRHSIIQIISLQLFYLSFANSHSPFLLDSHDTPDYLVIIKKIYQLGLLHYSKVNTKDPV